MNSAKPLGRGKIGIGTELNKRRAIAWVSTVIQLVLSHRREPGDFSYQTQYLYQIKNGAGVVHDYYVHMTTSAEK